MSKFTKFPQLLAAGALASTLAFSACSPGSLGNSTQAGASKDATIITVLGGNTDATMIPLKAAAEEFNSANPGIVVRVESRPQGADGDNLVKTKLATGDMAEIFHYNSGSLLQALDPAKHIVPITDEPYINQLDKTFKAAVTLDGKTYGVPFGSAMGGGILYNRKIYQQLGLSIPKTWDAFMSNNAKIKEAGNIDPVLQSYGDTWSSQILILSDFHNVASEVPDWATLYTQNMAKFSEQPALKSFERLETLSKSGYLNRDFASLKVSQALDRLSQGRAAHYPITSAVIGRLQPEQTVDIGFFGQPGDDSAKYGLTVWSSPALYISSSTQGEKLDAAKKFLAWIATTDACEIQTKALPPSGPYMVHGCKLPAGLPPVVEDLQSLMDAGSTTPALEFLSPVKGPNLEKITVEVGSGITSAAEGARRYDEDVKKQAQQLGLPGW